MWNGALGKRPEIPATPGRARGSIVLAEAFWDAISTGDSARLREILSPEIRWHALGAGDLSGTYVGVDAVLDLMASCGDIVDQLESSLLDIYGSDRGAILRYSVEAQRGARKLHIEQFTQIDIRDGRIFEAVSAPMDQVESNQFWQSSGA
jgi:uncharacterized protein